MKYEFRGKTVKDAIAKGLKKLSLRERDVDITILDEGLRGLFLIEGKQQAVVMMEPKSVPPAGPPDYTEAQKLLKEHSLEILARMGIIPDAVNTTMMTGRIYSNIICNDPEYVLDEELIIALETVIFEIINKSRDSQTKKTAKSLNPVDGALRPAADVGCHPVIKIHLDCNFIIKHKEEKIREEALKIARDTAADGKTRKWPGGALGFHYRKVIHDTVRDVKSVSSRSHGQGEEKTVEIFLLS
ncbi:MAG: hypothetical protein CVU77_08920 [Elusimicrobia bacterium HGW-Elusimicrobia-1]|jgi:spoIIIJ-associated protein|nr:MAG: hypothetical protein CVU77_08920 [Elusimicrobia bacterium HGW-Elusimicrobia-1]